VSTGRQNVTLPTVCPTLQNSGTHIIQEKLWDVINSAQENIWTLENKSNRMKKITVMSFIISALI
jgi:uncharacterized FlgJ-related protein